MKCIIFGTSTAKELKGAIRYFTSCYYLPVLLNTEEFKGQHKRIKNWESFEIFILHLIIQI